MEFTNVYKRYRKNMNNFRSIFGYVLKRPAKDDFWALENVSFDVKRGETLGIIGANGAGKSTILKILARVTKPSSGMVRVQGRLGALIELGAGFHPELTGRENIYLYGAILGMSRKEIREKFQEMVRFSELEEFLETPVKFYSSGMYLRLGFAVTAHIDHDVLLIDEVLAVGDEHFQRKCLERIHEFREQKKTAIIVSRNLPLMENICSKVVWLDKGNIRAMGEAPQVVALYEEYTKQQEQQNFVGEKASFKREKRWGTGAVLITDVHILDREENEKQLFDTGEDMTIRAKAEFFEDIREPVFGFIIYNASGVVVYNTNTKWKNIKLGEFPRGSVAYFLSHQKLNLQEGRYTITLAIASDDTLRTYDWRERMIEFTIANNNRMSEGIVELHSRLSVLRI